MIRKLAASIFRFFASLQLAIFLLLALGLVFAVGTLMESAHGTEVAKKVVYDSPWLSLLLILLALNLAAAALDRIPWKQKHAGFVITHLGIIMILIGSLITRAYGIEGQVAIAEGTTQSRMIVGEPMLQLFSEDSTPVSLFKIPSHPFPWKGEERMESLEFGEPVPTAKLVTYFPKSSRREEIHPAPNGPAALEVTLESSFMKQTHWLVLDDPQKSEIELGPAKLSFKQEPLKDPPTKANAKSFLEFEWENKKSQITLPDKTPETFPLEGTPYQVTVVKIYKDAVVDGKKLVDQSSEWNNPAVELLLEGKGLKEKHTVFSKFPDFPTFHGMKTSEAVAKIYFRRPDEGEDAPLKNELRFVGRQTELPFYQVKTKEKISQGTLKLHEEYSTGWMDFKFRVENYYPHAEVHHTFHPEPVNSQSEEHLTSIEIQLEKDGTKKTLWLEQGDRKMIELAGKIYQIVFGLRTVPLGFRLELKDFRVENYPGTNRPASFESDVKLEDDFSGLSRDINIRMNHPLKYRGYKVFQSGYQELPGQPQISIFSVAKDPGIPVKYAGALVLIGGILTMFYTRRFSNPAKHKGTPHPSPSPRRGKRLR